MQPQPVSLHTDGSLRAAFERFETDPALLVAVFTGGGGQFCAGADLKAVAGGPEQALMCDLRVAARGAVFGVSGRRWGVPLIDGRHGQADSGPR